MAAPRASSADRNRFRFVALGALQIKREDAVAAFGGTRSASTSTGTVTARSKVPALRSRRCRLARSPYWTALVPAMRIVLPLTWISRSSLRTPGTSVMMTMSSPLRNTLSNG
jgi:hypothetical protein